MNAPIFVMSAMSRSQFKGPVRQHTAEKRRNPADYGLPLDPFAGV